MSDRIESINEFMLAELRKNNVSDTPQHRIWFLQGLLDAWHEDPETSPEKDTFIFSVLLELAKLTLQRSLPDTKGE